jgi:ankyrin repeat protein
VLAAAGSHYEVATKLIENGALVDRKDRLQAMSHTAEKQINGDLVRFLLSRGADLHIRDIWGRTPLH